LASEARPARIAPDDGIFGDLLGFAKETPQVRRALAPLCPVCAELII